MNSNCWQSSSPLEQPQRSKSSILSADVLYKKTIINATLNNDGFMWKENDLTNIIKYQFITNVKRSKTKPDLCINHISKTNDSMLVFQKFKIKFKSSEITESWSKAISKQIKKSYKRLKSLIFFVDKIDNRSKLNADVLLKEYMKNVMHEQKISYVIKEINSLKDIEDLVEVFEQIKSYDGIVIMSGDETASTIISNIINFFQIDDSCVKHVKVPFTIIPIGYHNDIAASIWKTENIQNIFLNMFLCNTFQIDILSLTKEGSKKRIWGFNCHYGFYTVLEKYRLENNNNTKESILRKKSLKKLKSFNCAIQCKSSMQSNSHPLDDSTCSKHCASCNLMTMSVTNTPIFSLNTSTQSSDTDPGNYETIKPSEGVSWIIVNCIPCQNDAVGNPFSPACHFNDGSADLIIVKSTSTNDLKKYLKYQNIDGSHLKLSFVDSKRVEDMSITIHDQKSWTDSDLRNAFVSTLPKNSKNNMVIIEDTSCSSSEEEMKELNSVENSKPKINVADSKSHKGKINKLMKPMIKACKELTKTTDASQEIGDYKKPNMLESDKEKERKAQKLKKKKCELKKFESSWMLDYNVMENTCSTIHIKVHSGVVSFFGDAMD